MKHYKTITLALVLFIFLGLANFMGCSDSDSTVPNNQSRTLLGDEEPFYGSLLQKVLSGLIEGAEQKTGADVMGEILSLLGWGGGGDDKQYLEAMTQTLQKIVGLLNDIIQSLNALLLQLEITEEEILANTNDPTQAITQIETANEELQGLAQGKDPGSVDEATLKAFVERVEDTFVIDEQINAIHDAILPPDIAKTPVLDNFANLGIDRVKQQGKSIADAYLGLESYFSQLLYYQMQGVNLFVETKIFRTKAGLSQIDGMDAKAYMDFFQKNLLWPEMDNFMNNVWKLILSHVSLVDSNSFLPQDTSAILSRADFFIIQALNQDHFGLRGTLISTKDLISGVIGLSARNQQTSDIYQETGTLHTALGPTYDFWEGNKIKGVSEYYVIGYDFENAGNFPNDGNYDITAQSDGAVLASATVQNYTPDYVQDSTGTIQYGHALMYKRVGAEEAFNNNTTWVWWSKDLQNTSANGSASSKYAGLDGGAQNDSYKGEAEIDAHFIFEGNESGESIPLTINYSAHAYGNTQSNSITDNSGFANSKIQYIIGIWDLTDDFVNVHILEQKTASTGNNGSSSINDSPKGSWAFPNPSPGHEYYVGFYCYIEGNSYDGGADGKITVDSIAGNVSLSFAP